tara:strand:- start:379 stop:891 length:513 start_codon:yes stop_codon:yes gene_type:complete
MLSVLVSDQFGLLITLFNQSQAIIFSSKVHVVKSFVLTETFLSDQAAAVKVDKFVSELLQSLNKRLFQLSIVFIYALSQKFTLFVSVILIPSNVFVHVNVLSQSNLTWSNANCVIYPISQSPQFFLRFTSSIIESHSCVIPLFTIVATQPVAVISILSICDAFLKTTLVA